MLWQKPSQAIRADLHRRHTAGTPQAHRSYATTPQIKS